MQLPLLAAPHRQGLPAYDHSVIGMQYVSLSGEPHNALHSLSIKSSPEKDSILITVQASSLFRTGFDWTSELRVCCERVKSLNANTHIALLLLGKLCTACA